MSTTSIRRGAKINYHTPNALNARFIDEELAELMVESGFKVVYLGFESSAYEWQKKTGGKVYSTWQSQSAFEQYASARD